MIDNFKGEPINSLKYKIDGIKSKYNLYRPIHDSSAVIEELLELLEYAGNRIAKLERDVDTLKNRKLDD